MTEAPAIDLAVDGRRAADWDELADALPPWPVADLQLRRLVVVAPHPDDESLGIGGTIATLARRVPVLIVCVTDGEAAPSTLAPAALAEIRSAELDAATAHLAARPEVVRLGLPDGGVHAARDQLAQRLGALVQRGDVVLSTLDGDGHPDHDAVGRVARRVAAARRATHLWFPVWAWHWHDPQHSVLARGLRVDLDASAAAAKAAAVGAYRSQLEGDDPVVPPRHVERCLRPFEVVIPA